MTSAFAPLTWKRWIEAVKGENEIAAKTFDLCIARFVYVKGNELRNR